MTVSDWLSNNYIEVFGAIAGIVYVFLEIRQSIWLWPVGIITSAVYILVFFTSKFYADMSLQGYYLLISCLGWYWWLKGTGQKKVRERMGEGEIEERSDKIPQSGKGRKRERVKEVLQVSRIDLRTGVMLGIVFVLLFAVMWIILFHLTDSPVPGL